jgi:hypothetical protein
MSCPYLERGRISLCHAVGERGMEVKNDQTETDCFSGDFSHCSLLLFQTHRKRKAWRYPLSMQNGPMKEGGPDDRRKILPAA